MNPGTPVFTTGFSLCLIWIRLIWSSASSGRREMNAPLRRSSLPSESREVMPIDPPNETEASDECRRADGRAPRVRPPFPRVDRESSTDYREKYGETRYVRVVDARQQPECVERILDRLRRLACHPAPFFSRHEARTPIEGIFYEVLGILEEPEGISQRSQVPVCPMHCQVREQTRQYKQGLVAFKVRLRQHVSISRTYYDQQSEEFRAFREPRVELFRDRMVELR